MHKTSKHVVIRTSIHQFAKPLMETFLASTFLVGEVMAAPGELRKSPVDEAREEPVVQPVISPWQTALESRLQTKHEAVLEEFVAREDILRRDWDDKSALKRTQDAGRVQDLERLYEAETRARSLSRANEDAGAASLS